MESVVRTSMTYIVRFVVERYPNVGFTKCKVKRVVNLFEDTGSVPCIINYVQMLSLTL
jgi:hypothetical protein